MLFSATPPQVPSRKFYVVADIPMYTPPDKVPLKSKTPHASLPGVLVNTRGVSHFWSTNFWEVGGVACAAIERHARIIRIFGGVCGKTPIAHVRNVAGLAVLAVGAKSAKSANSEAVPKTGYPPLPRDPSGGPPRGLPRGF